MKLLRKRRGVLCVDVVCIRCGGEGLGVFGQGTREETLSLLAGETATSVLVEVPRQLRTSPL